MKKSLKKKLLVSSKKKNITESNHELLWEKLFDLKFPLLSDDKCGIKSFIREYVVPNVEVQASIQTIRDCATLVSKTFEERKYDKNKNKMY